MFCLCSAAQAQKQALPAANPKSATVLGRGIKQRVLAMLEERRFAVIENIELAQCGAYASLQIMTDWKRELIALEKRIKELGGTLEPHESPR